MYMVSELFFLHVHLATDLGINQALQYLPTNHWLLWLPYDLSHSPENNKSTNVFSQVHKIEI